MSYAASYIGSRVTTATEDTMRAAERTLRYAQQNPLRIPLPYRPHKGVTHIKAYVDAAMGNDNDVYGHTGILITINDMPVLWRSKKQRRVARSSAKAELIAADDTFD